MRYKIVLSLQYNNIETDLSEKRIVEHQISYRNLHQPSMTTKGLFPLPKYQKIMIRLDEVMTTKI